MRRRGSFLRQRIQRQPARERDAGRLQLEAFLLPAGEPIQERAALALATAAAAARATRQRPLSSRSQKPSRKGPRTRERAC